MYYDTDNFLSTSMKIVCLWMNTPSSWFLMIANSTLSCRLETSSRLKNLPPPFNIPNRKNCFHLVASSYLSQGQTQIFANKYSEETSTFPFLIDPIMGVWMFESNDNINYLYQVYGSTKSQIPSSLSPVSGIGHDATTGTWYHLPSIQCSQGTTECLALRRITLLQNCSRAPCGIRSPAHSNILSSR